MIKIYIHTNKKQFIGAQLAKFSIEKYYKNNPDITVDYINVDELDVFKNFIGKSFLRKGHLVTHDEFDLQSFTLSRFMPPELCGYEGKAMVIDPDIFMVQPIDEFLNLDLKGKSLACCSKHGAFDTSMMLMDCQKLQNWKISEILNKLENKELDYSEIMSLKIQDPTTILEVPRIWNSLDKLEPNTKMLHTTNRLTQPWKTGLPIDFQREKMAKIFGIIPREAILKVLGRLDTKYLPHPDKKIEDFFFRLAKEAYDAKAITDQDIDAAINNKYVRSDFKEKLSEY